MINLGALALSLTSLAFVVDLATGVRRGRSHGSEAVGQAPLHSWDRTVGVGLLACGTALLCAAHRADLAGIGGMVALVVGCALLVKGALATPRR